MEDPWKLLDPHDPVTTSDSNRPFKKGIYDIVIANIAERCNMYMYIVQFMHVIVCT